MKSYDLRREVEVAKIQTLIDAVDAIDTSGLATEVTLDGVKTQTDKLNFTDGKLDVNASVSADGLASEITLADVLLQNKRMENLLVSLLEEQQKTNKLLKKIYNPE